MSGSMRTSDCSWTSIRSAKAPMPSSAVTPIPVLGEARRSPRGRTVGWPAADVRVARQTLLALAAEAREAGHDVVAGLDVGDPGAHRLHDPGTLVAQHEGSPTAEHHALRDVQVAVAHAARHRPHQDLVRPAGSSRTTVSMVSGWCGSRNTAARTSIGEEDRWTVRAGPEPVGAKGAGGCAGGRATVAPVLLHGDVGRLGAEDEREGDVVGDAVARLEEGVSGPITGRRRVRGPRWRRRRASARTPPPGGCRASCPGCGARCGSRRAARPRLHLEADDVVAIGVLLEGLDLGPVSAWRGHRSAARACSAPRRSDPRAPSTAGRSCPTGGTLHELERAAFHGGRVSASQVEQTWPPRIGQKGWSWCHGKTRSVRSSLTKI